jgi:hypothetical protein
VGFFSWKGFPLGNHVVNGLLFISFVCNYYVFKVLHILLSWISVGSVFHTSTSFHLVSEPDHLRIQGVRDKVFFI